MGRDSFGVKNASPPSPSFTKPIFELLNLVGVAEARAVGESRLPGALLNGRAARRRQVGAREHAVGLRAVGPLRLRLAESVGC